MVVIFGLLIKIKKKYLELMLRYRMFDIVSEQVSSLLRVILENVSDYMDDYSSKDGTPTNVQLNLPHVISF